MGALHLRHPPGSLLFGKRRSSGRSENKNQSRRRMNTPFEIREIPNRAAALALALLAFLLQGIADFA